MPHPKPAPVPGTPVSAPFSVSTTRTISSYSHRPAFDGEVMWYDDKGRPLPPGFVPRKVNLSTVAIPKGGNPHPPAPVDQAAIDAKNLPGIAGETLEQHHARAMAGYIAASFSIPSPPKPK